jgi:hypothetical protein
MNFVETSRRVEPQAECILFLYLQDATGAPVASKQVKIHAGPPPTGEPPYFVDDDPTHADRRTDASGKFQFIVANGAPTNGLDFFVQVLGAEGQPESAPVHFPFTAGEAQWVVVTLQSSEAMPERDPENALGTEGTAAPSPEPVAEPVPAAALPSAPPPPPVGILRGRIDNVSAGARLVLRNASRTLDALVASDGLYSFTNVPVGTYSLELSGKGVIQPALNISADQTATFDYPARSATPANKVFKHYLLFGPGSQAGTLTNLILALDYIVHFAPVVGFSIDEALNAERVTIVGSGAAVSVQDEQRLREGGCLVVRLQASDSYALENLFQQLLASGSPYPA